MSPTNRGGRLRLARAAALVLVALLAVPGAADAINRNYQVRDDDVARFAILEFNRHAERAEWRAAILDLQKLFDLPPQRSVVVAVEGSRPLQRYENAWRAAVRLFDALPADGRAMWEEMERRPAEELLARGLRLRRDEDLAAAARRYPARDVRRRAYDALAHLGVARGDFDRAARDLESLLDCAEPADHPQILARMAFAHAQTGDVESLARTAARAQPHAAAMVPGPAGQTRLDGFVERMRAHAEASARRFAGARVFGGDRHGSGISDPPPLADQPGWTVSTGFETGQENEDAFNGSPPDVNARPVLPAIAHGSVLVNNGLSLSAYEVSTGRRSWRVATAQPDAAWRDNPGAYSTVAVADGVCYAALATRSDAPDIDRRFYGKIIIYSLAHRVLHAVDVRTGDLLWSHDTAHIQGRADAAEIERESVASAPLVVGDDVIVLTWKFDNRYEARLVCFDRRTGATRWRTSIVYGQQEMNLFGRPVKELIVPPLAELDGQVYLATGMGIAAAVDRVTGAISWLTEYTTTDIPQTNQWYETRDRKVTWRPSPISATPTAVVMAPLESAELWAFDPRTGAKKWSWRRDSDGAWAQWFLGTAGNRAYALGSRLFAFDLENGRNAWTTPDAGKLAKTGVEPRPALGSGVLTGTMVYVPTQRGIVQMDAKTGDCVDTRPLPEPSQQIRRQPRTQGNLLAADGALVVVTANDIDGYYRFEDLAARLKARLAATPDDPQLRLEAGDVFRNAGRHDEAIECFEKGLAAAPPSGRTAGRTEGSLRRSLTEALLARAKFRRTQKDTAGAFADLQRAVEVARERGDSVRALFALADGAVEAGRNDVSDASLQRVATEFGDVQTRVGGDDRVDAGALAALTLGRRAAERGDVAAAVGAWLRLLDERPEASISGTNATAAVRSALDELRAKRGEEVTRLVDAHARKALDQARAAGDVFALRRIAKSSPSPAVAAEAALTAATIHLENRRPRDAALALEHLIGMRPPPAPETLARALWDLAAAYRALDDVQHERGALSRMKLECDGVKLPDGRTAGEAARAELADPRFRGAPVSLPDPRLPLTQQWQTVGADDEPPMALLSIQGQRPREFDGRLLFAQDQSVRCVDGRTGALAWTADVGLDLRSQYGASGGVVLVGWDKRTLPRVVRADHFRAEDGKRTWTQKLGGALGSQYADSASSLGLVYVLRFEHNVRGDRVSVLTALSADTGERFAERELPGLVEPRLAVAADAVLVYEVLTQGGPPRRRITTLDGATLAPRGVVEVEGAGRSPMLNPPGTAVIVTAQRHDSVAAIDVRTGAFAWPVVPLQGQAVKSLRVVPGGVIVTDDGDQVRRIDAKTGAQTWLRPLGVPPTAGGGGRVIGYDGEAADGDLVVVTMTASQVGSDAWAVALDSATGAVRWEVPLPVDGRALPRPQILQGLVAYELNVRKPDSYDCRVVLLNRQDGAVAATLAHPTISRGRVGAQAVFQGPFVVLWAPPRADVAVYAGTQSPK